MNTALMIAVAFAGAFAAGSLWREAVWRWSIGATLSQVRHRARRASELAQLLELTRGRAAPVMNLAELRERRRRFDWRIGGRGRP